MFAETVNLSRYMTHVTPTELVLCAVTHEDIDHFIIETSKPNVLVRWNLVAHRLGYEDIRLKRIQHMIAQCLTKNVFKTKTRRYING